MPERSVRVQHCNTIEGSNLNPRAAKGPHPRCSLHSQGLDVLLQGVGSSISEILSKLRDMAAESLSISLAFCCLLPDLGILLQSLVSLS